MREKVHEWERKYTNERENRGGFGARKLVGSNPGLYYKACRSARQTRRWLVSLILGGWEKREKKRLTRKIGKGGIGRWKEVKRML